MENTEQPRIERVIAYVDGFNLYFSLKRAGYDRYLWLNLWELVKGILKPNQQLIYVKNFTALITDDIMKRNRQKAYLAALTTIQNSETIYGKFMPEERFCSICGGSYYKHCEKRTDVGIATHIMADLYENRCDMAFLISNDTDLIPPVKYVNENIKNKRVFVAFPPNGVNDELRGVAKGIHIIGRGNLSNSQFDNQLTLKDGSIITKPATWV